MRTIYLALAVIAFSLSATSCRSRQVSHRPVHGFAPVTEVQQPGNVVPSQPVVQVSFRQEAGQTVVSQTPAQSVVAQTPTQPSMRDLLEAGQTAVNQTPVQPVVVQTPTQPSMRDLLEAGQTAVRQTPAQPVVAQTPPPPPPIPTPAHAPTVTRLPPVGQTNVGITFIESPEPVRQTPAQQTPAQQVPVNPALVQHIPAQQTPINPALVQHTPVQQAPVNPAFVQHTPAHQPAVRQENISPIFAADAADLRRYSVVVASLSNRWSAETLQRRLQNDGHHVILAQNERGMFRVIVGSFDNRFQAAAQKDELRRRYSAMGSPDFLVRTYGIPFNDLWILGRHF